jgi:intracellular multiplication protein IcmJ
MRQTPTPKIAPRTTDIGFVARWDNQPLLSIKRKAWRAADEHAHLADDAFGAIRESIIARDKNACQFCGFRASKGLEVHHLDDDHHNNDPANLLTICNLCHQVFHLGLAGARGAGFLSYVPELTQAEVNHLARARFVCEMAPGEQQAQDAKRLEGLYGVLEAKADSIKAAFGLDISSPLKLAEVFDHLTDEQYDSRKAALKDIRLVPTKAAFREDQLMHLWVSQASIFNCNPQAS